MDMLLKEMQEMDRIVQQPVMGPKVNEVIHDTVNPVPMPLEAGADSSFAEVCRSAAHCDIYGIIDDLGKFSV